MENEDPMIHDALFYLSSLQAPDGGFLYDGTYSVSDGDSTAMTIQALLAAGENPSSGWQWAQTLTGTEQITMTIRKPADRVMSLQTHDGAFEWQPGQGANLWTTLTVMPALAGRPFPWRRTELYLPLIYSGAALAQ
jgi:uncharacterized protein YfaS (alpha-2-macroglobulin family)